MVFMVLEKVNILMNMEKNYFKNHIYLELLVLQQFLELHMK